MKRLKRIYILGTSGSGKTYISEILSKKLNIPKYDSDDVLFIKKFTKIRTKDKRKIIIDKISKKSKWIIDSQGSDWNRDPMKKADLIIWLQTSAIKRGVRILRRYNLRKDNPKFDEPFNEMFKVLKYSLSYKWNKHSGGYKETNKFIRDNKLHPAIITNNDQLSKLFLKLGVKLK